MGWLKCGLTVFEKDLCGWRSDCLREADLFAVVGGVLHADQVSVGPSVQVCVLSADVSVASVARFALAAEHGVGEMSQVVAACVFVAVVASVEAGITGRAHLQGRRSTNQRSHRFSMLQIHGIGSSQRQTFIGANGRGRCKSRLTQPALSASISFIVHLRDL